LHYSLTAYPADVYICDPIEGCLFFFYSVNAREVTAGELSGT